MPASITMLPHRWHIRVVKALVVFALAAFVVVGT
jgi:hypothetical protein